MGGKGSGQKGLSRNSEKRAHQLANLQPYPPGVSGNPGGRPKTKPLSDAYRKIGDMDYEKRKSYKPQNGWEAIALGQHAVAERGKTYAAIEIGDRTEGKVPQQVELDASGEVKIVIGEDDARV